MQKIEDMFYRNFKTEAHAYLRIKGFRVPTPSHSPPVYVHLDQNKIYCEGRGYRGAIPEYGERWFTKDGKPLEVRYGAINIAEDTFDATIEVVVHEICHLALPNSRGFADPDYRDASYAQIENALRIGVKPLVKEITPGALLRHKGEHFSRIMDFYKKENLNSRLTVAKHSGAFYLLDESSLYIKTVFRGIRLKDRKKLSRFSKSKPTLMRLQIVRMEGYYFNEIAERVEQAKQTEIKALASGIAAEYPEYFGKGSYVKSENPKFEDWSNILAQDPELAQIL